MEVSLDNVFDLPILAGCRIEVDIYITLGIDDGGHALRRNHVRRVGQAAQIESLHLYRFHALSLGQDRRLLAAPYFGCATTRRYGKTVFQPAGYFFAASSLDTAGTMITSLPGFQFTGVATWCLAVSCMESSTRRTSSKLRPVVIG